MTNQLQLGLRENWKQFTILVIVNAFVGGMIGMERSIIPKFASEDFGISSNVAILSFIIAFGISKAITNFFTGKLANQYGRKKLLILGWLIAIPIPFILINANHWNWVIFANVLLGMNQGLAWSCTVIMKIDIVGDKNRGLAMGINEFAGYLSVGIVAFLSSWIADHYGINPYVFYLGLGLAFSGLLISIFFVKETIDFVQIEKKTNQSNSLNNVFLETTFKNKSLSSITQAGLVNNLNDGMIWGLLPILLFDIGFTLKHIGIVVAVYPAIWGIGQLFTGKMADLYSRKKLLFYGMLLQGVAILFIPYFESITPLIIIMFLLGTGTAIVYPTFLTAIAALTTPIQRAESIGTFRLWRDLGYAIGALLSGVIADFLGVGSAIIAIGLITIFSSGIIKFRMPADSPK